MGCSGQSSSQPVQDGREKNVRPFDPRHLDIAYLHPPLYRWASMTPLRQFKGVPAEVVRKAEGKQFVSGGLVCMKHQLMLLFSTALVPLL